jgi:folate-binding protein YgfZ
MKNEPFHMSESARSIEYSAVRDGGAGLLDLSSRGRLLVSGAEAVMFLNGLITNDMKTLGVNSWMPAVFPNVQGRLLAAVRIIHREDGFLIDTEGPTLETVAKLLERFALAGDFRVTDLSSETAMISVQGQKAADVVRAAVGDDATPVERETISNVKLASGAEGTVIRATHTAEDGFDLFVDASETQVLLESLIESGGQSVGPDVLETLRIEGGIPRYGVDMDETNVVTETNLDEAVSFTKGCYIGQEIIARIKYRGHVAKKLTGLTFESEGAVENAAKILSSDDKEIGRVTSVTFSPRLDRTIALGYLKYDYLSPGTSVKVSSSGREIGALVAELPLIRGSWYSD